MVLGGRTDMKFSLANYDYVVVYNLAILAAGYGTVRGFTDRQAELALKLIKNYRRQFAKNDVDVEPILSNPQYRYPIREINREKRMIMVEDAIHLSFPYKEDMITEIRNFVKHSHGRCEWIREQKVWRVALTEYNLNYLITWAATRGFEVDQKLLDLYEKILLVEQQPYEIKLIKTKQGYEITNASRSLVDYVETHAGQDLVKLIDLAGVLGYTVSDEVAIAAAEVCGVDFVAFALERELRISHSEKNYKSLLDYCKITNRYPICVYNPGAVIPEFLYAEGLEVVEFNHNGETTSSEEEVNRAKLIYARRIPPKTCNLHIPLLVSTMEMMYGGRRLEWLNKAERIVVFSDSKLIKEK